MKLFCKMTCEQGLPKRSAPDKAPVLKFTVGKEYDFGDIKTDSDGEHFAVSQNQVTYRVPKSIQEKLVTLGYLVPA